jgi:hypothetical protein
MKSIVAVDIDIECRRAERNITTPTWAISTIHSIAELLRSILIYA